MEQIYLSEKPERLEAVYARQLPLTVYRKADILATPEAFRDTRYIFSTWGMPEFTAQEIKTYLPGLEAVFYAAGSVQRFARPFLQAGVKVFSAWAANAVPVAEYAVAQIVLANKGFFASAPLASAGDRAGAGALASQYPGNFGVRVGIIGAGMIGKMVIRRLKDYDLKVVTFDPFLPEQTARELGVEKVTLQELFSTCQVVSNHLANNAQTKGMLNGKLFSQMLPYATFLNTGRGAQVVEEELIATLRARPDLTAVLDVTFPEPPETDSGLLRLPNCILTPHIAGSSGNEVQRMASYMLEEYRRFTRGESCLWEVTETMLETMA